MASPRLEHQLNRLALLGKFTAKSAARQERLSPALIFPGRIIKIYGMTPEPGKSAPGMKRKIYEASMSEEFVVHDRRLFGKDGRVNAEGGAGAEEPAAARPAPAENTAPAAGPRDMPPPTFPSLLVGLATSALINLGENHEPGPEPPRVDLPAAKRTIDLLGILKTKTKGNLESEEEALLETLLYDLRLKYVKASRQ
jgi:hypothetical protein